MIEGSIAPPAGRILILLHDFSGGGSERIMIRLANAWSRAGRDVEILCGSDDGTDRTRVDPAVRVRALSPPVPRGRGSRRRMAQVATPVIAASGADVVVSPGNYHLPILGALGPVGIPLVCKLSNPLQASRNRWWGTWLFRRRTQRFCRRLDMLVAMSPALRDEAAAFLRGGPALRIAPEPSYADDLPVPASRPARWPPRVLCAGRLVRQKRFDRAIAALAALGEPGAVLTIAGDGPEAPRLRAVAQRLGVADQVRFVGRLPTIEQALRDADLLLSSSEYEGYPGVVMEALGQGVPVVTTNASPAMAEIMRDASFGRIVDPAPASLAAALRGVAQAGGIAHGPLSAILRDHREGTAGRAWLEILDEVVAHCGRR